MTIMQSSTNTVKQRVEHLRAIGNQLKTEFASIDKEIDSILRYVKPFYVTPELMTRPTIICLWGMTGVGKTHLIRRLVALMGLENAYGHFDMGEYAGNFSDYALRYQMEDYADCIPDGRGVLVFDEFQTIRFINEQGSEVDRPAARLIWDLLDGAPLARKRHVSNLPLEYLQKLQRFKDMGGKVEKNAVVECENQFRRLFPNYQEPPGSSRKNKSDSQVLCIDEFRFANLYKANPARFRFNENYEYWQSQLAAEVTDIDAAIELVEQVHAGFKLCEPKDLSRCIVFCVGNLDEVYLHSHEANPDIDIEELRAETEKITLAQVKDALAERFRPEQIARLGNNHVIYPSLDRECYWRIIDNQIAATAQRAQEHYQVKLDIDPSVRELVFNESVFPTQGARPVVTSFGPLFDSFLAEAMCELCEAKGVISWRYDAAEQSYVFARGSKEHRCHVQLLVEYLRRSDESEKQCVVAVHEAGHAVAYMQFYGRPPKQIRSRTASSAGGYMLPQSSDDYKTRQEILDEARWGLAGFKAEALVFGEDNVSNGAGGDLRRVLSTLKAAVGKAGLFPEHWLGYLNEANAEFVVDHAHSEKVSQIATTIMSDCESETTQVLEEHFALLVDVASYLAEHSSMSQETFLDYASKHGLTEQPRFSHKAKLAEVQKSLNEHQENKLVTVA
ncbi:MAG: hypothetical protein JSS66_06570 [Armatimonadetes bacterium]|nr:hypothetical protein [Armatimonadota bacterium]